MNDKRSLYLDGLRALLALIVVNEHLMKAFFPQTLRNTVLYPPDGSWFEILSFTPIHLLYNGVWAVMMFFVLSGYVLCSVVKSRGENGALPVLWYAISRYVRLSIPILASLLLVYLLTVIGAFSHDQFSNTFTTQLSGPYSAEGAPTFMGILYQGLIGTLFQFDLAYNPVLWTMAFEWYGSLFVLLYVLIGRLPLGFEKLITAVQVVTLLIALWCTWGNGASAFIFGIIVHEVKVRYSDVTFFKWVWVKGILATVGLFFISYFVRGGSANPFQLLPVDVHYDSLAYFYSAIGSAFLLMLIVTSSKLQTYLSWAPLVWLGERSFSLYLTHYIVITSLGMWLVLSMDRQYEVAVALAMFISCFVSIALANVFYVTVERLSIIASKRIDAFPKQCKNIKRSDSRLVQLTQLRAQK